MKLLNQSIRSYLLYSSILIFISIPVFYFALQKILLHSTDESLQDQLVKVRSNIYLIQSEEDLKTWKKLDWDISLEEVFKQADDSLKTIEYFNNTTNEKEAYREISGNINVINRIYRLTIRVSLVENEDLVQAILLIQVILLMLLLTGLLLINKKISRKIWEPFYGTLEAVQQHELHRDKSISLPPGKTDEFNDLNKAVTQLVERDLHIFRQQKEFIENASHEMQTPLAIFQSKLELLMQTEPLNEEQAALIEQLNDTNQRLSALNRSLLMLSRIENNQYAGLEKIDLFALLNRLIQSLNETLQVKKMHLTMTFPGSKIIQANKTLMEILFTNLLVNAIRYSETGGTVNIHFVSNTLIIQNTSVVQIPLDDSKIFERFYKGSNDTGTGLGLAISKNICALYDFKLTYSFSERFHNFHIYFNNVV